MNEVRIAQTDAEILSVYPVMKELRPRLASPEAFLAQVRRQQAGAGWQLAMIEDGGATVAAAGFRLGENLSAGRFLYVDDLVSLASHRSRGLGKILLDWLKELARKEDCDQFQLDSGTQRLGAHRFYLRESLDITAFHFTRNL